MSIAKYLAWLAPLAVLIIAYQNADSPSAPKDLKIQMEGESRIEGCPGEFDPGDRPDEKCVVSQAQLASAIPTLIFPFSQYKSLRSGGGLSGRGAIAIEAPVNGAFPASDMGPATNPFIKQWVQKYNKLHTQKEIQEWKAKYDKHCKDGDAGNDCKKKDKFQFNLAAPCVVDEVDKVGNLKGLYTITQGDTKYLGFAIKLDNSYEAPAGDFFIHLQMLHVNEQYCMGAKERTSSSTIEETVEDERQMMAAMEEGEVGHPPLTMGILTRPETEGSPTTRTRDPVRFYLEAQHGDVKGVPHEPTQLYSQELRRGTWYHFLLEMAPEPTPTKVDANGFYNGKGRLTLWANGKQVMTYRGPWTYLPNIQGAKLVRSKNFLLGLGFYRTRQILSQKFQLDDIKLASSPKEALPDVVPQEKFVSAWGREICDYSVIEHLRPRSSSRLEVPLVQCRGPGHRYLSLYPKVGDKNKYAFVRVSAKNYESESSRIARLRDVPLCGKPGVTPCRVVCVPRCLKADKCPAGHVFAPREKNPHVCVDRSPGWAAGDFRYVLFNE